MDSFTVVTVIAVACLAAGGIIGLLVGRAGSDAQQRNELQNELNSARLELEEYKENVSDHFTRTAELVNNLTRSYSDVHQHLAAGAEGLCNNDQLSEPLRLLQPDAEQPAEGDAESPAEQTAAASDNSTGSAVEPPRDYAPKPAPDAEGTLSESYGLQSQEEETVDHDPSTTPDHVKA